MDHLFGALAPVTEAAWSAIEDEASRSLRHFLAARRLVDFSGPHGWDRAALPTGGVKPIEPPAPGVEASIRLVLPLVELRAPFSLSRAELEGVDRGGAAPDLHAVSEAARNLATAEDSLVFGGAGGVVDGCASASPHPVVPIGDDYGKYPSAVARAVATLKEGGVGGPYGIALGPRCYRGVIESTEFGGYPVLEHLRLILEGPVVRAPTVDGALVLSLRGGDFELVVGQDLSVGYHSHDAEAVRLYIEESITFRNLEPAAAVRLAHTT